jgi:hypothetical protein
MFIRRILLIAGALVLVLAATVFLVEPTVRSEQPATPSDQAAAPAIADLAGRLGVDAGAIAVESVRAETWNDASLGLPEPGKMYAQVISEGHVVTLTCDGQTYVYHVAGDTARLAP